MLAIPLHFKSYGCVAFCYNDVNLGCYYKLSYNTLELIYQAYSDDNYMFQLFFRMVCFENNLLKYMYMYVYRCSIIIFMASFFR